MQLLSNAMDLTTGSLLRSRYLGRPSFEEERCLTTQITAATSRDFVNDYNNYNSS